MNITLDHVTVAFGRTLALDEITLEIPEGTSGLFGPNGSGKSTLLATVAGLIKPIRGTVTIDGVPHTGRNEELRRSIGYAGHASGLYGRLSLVENLRLFGTLYGADLARVDTLIEALDLSAFATRPVLELSAGSKRRGAVARALINDPDLLLLDEPYANVDDEAAETISGAIKAWKGPGKIALVATHGAKKVKAYADGGIILQRGRLIRTGRYTEAGFAAT